MSSFPQEFPIPRDQGGPGAGELVGGFGGNAGSTRDAHRAVVRRVGKAPVLLIHGNGGTADTGRWDMHDLKRMLSAAGYPDELIWALSYLGSGTPDLLASHTNNVAELRDFVDNVCSYLAVDVVDVIAHSLGCTLTYAVCRGLDHRQSPIGFSQPTRWHRLGTFVGLAGAFHGLGAGGFGEWRTGGAFMTGLLAETDGGGGETPFAEGKPMTPSPTPHNITYFTGTARGDFIDVQKVDTGQLAGAQNKVYNVGTGLGGHEVIKESQLVFHDFLPLLNRVPPVPPVLLTVDRDSGAYPAPLTVTANVKPDDLGVSVVATRLTKEFVNGFIVDTTLEGRQETLQDGEASTLATSGMWQVTFSAPGGVDDVVRTYWVGVPAITVTIDEPTEPFTESLLVTARALDQTARLFHSVDGVAWILGANVTITQDVAVSFIAIDPGGIASPIVTRRFTREIRWDATFTGNATEHFLAGHIDANEFVAYSQQFGFFAPFALYRVDGEWMLDPTGRMRQPQRAPARAATGDGRPLIRIRSGDEQSGRHAGSITMTIEAVDGDGPLTVYYTRDGSRPDSRSATFVGHRQFELTGGGNQVITCYATDHHGTEHYQVFPLTLAG